jgi:hypothetical protein
MLDLKGFAGGYIIEACYIQSSRIYPSLISGLAVQKT